VKLWKERDTQGTYMFERSKRTSGERKQSLSKAGK
jgi:hypothetical protein